MATREAQGGTLVVGRGFAGSNVARLLGKRGATRVEGHDVPGVRFTGFIGWFITRTYHLYQLPLVSRKLRVVVDWTVSLSSAATSWS